MKDELIYRKKFLSLLSIIALGLFALASYLYSDNRSYKNKNAQLILQNDSLVSVNLTLKAAIKNVKLDFTKQTVRTDRQRHE